LSQTSTEGSSKNKNIFPTGLQVHLEDLL
jgi:hypothetical protein